MKKTTKSKSQVLTPSQKLAVKQAKEQMTDKKMRDAAAKHKKRKM